MLLDDAREHPRQKRVTSYFSACQTAGLRTSSIPAPAGADDEVALASLALGQSALVVCKWGCCSPKINVSPHALLESTMSESIGAHHTLRCPRALLSNSVSSSSFSNPEAKQPASAVLRLPTPALPKFLAIEKLPAIRTPWSVISTISYVSVSLVLPVQQADCDARRGSFDLQ